MTVAFMCQILSLLQQQEDTLLKATSKLKFFSVTCDIHVCMNTDSTLKTSVGIIYTGFHIQNLADLLLQGCLGVDWPELIDNDIIFWFKCCSVLIGREICATAMFQQSPAHSEPARRRQKKHKWKIKYWKKEVQKHLVK